MTRSKALIGSTGDLADMHQGNSLTQFNLADRPKKAL
jgi:hypothetical protein